MANRAISIAALFALTVPLLPACASIDRLTPAFPESAIIDEEGVRSDLRDWAAGLRALHPDLPARADMERLETVLAATEQEIGGPMTELEAWRLFSRLNPTLNDGHAGILLSEQYERAQSYVDRGGSIFPFAVHVDEHQRLFIAGAGAGVDGVTTGDEILSINGLPTVEIVSEMLDRAHGDTPRFRRELVARRFPLMFLLLFGDMGDYRVETRALDGARARVTVKGARRLPALLQPAPSVDEIFEFGVLEGGVGYIKAGSFAYEHSEFFKKFTEEAFGRFHDAGVQALIIDIRDNSGGDDPLWQEGLMQNITTTPYRHVSRYKIRVTEDNADPGDVVGAVQSGEYRQLFAPKADNPLRFHGPVYILVGPYTYSSAIQFAVAAQDYGIAKIAGEETGGLSCQTGRVTQIPMNRTKLNAFAPILSMTRPSGVGCERGVVPDIPLEIDPYSPSGVVEALRKFAAARL